MNKYNKMNWSKFIEEVKKISSKNNSDIIRSTSYEEILEELKKLIK
tara:strand:+ start:802 stop:939 length:138 start_codon:yes stop_codon:yes gene_type:complete